MSERRRLVKRIRRRMWGGTLDVRIYSDNTVRARCDHPSDNPAIELAMAGRFLEVARDLIPGVVIGPMTWKSDPPKERP